MALEKEKTFSYPLLKAHASKYGPLALVHFDSHSDTEEGYFNHGPPFADAYRAGLIDTNAHIKVGIRGPLYHSDELKKRKPGDPDISD